MSQLQKKPGDPAGDAKAKKKVAKGDPTLAAAARRGQELLDKQESEKQKQQKKPGHWVVCCGVRTWVED